MKLFVFFADKLLQWGRRVEQESGYRPFEPVRGHNTDRAIGSIRERDDEGPPEHWARLVASAPPPHWLDLFRQATDPEEEFFPADSGPHEEESCVFSEAENDQTLPVRPDAATQPQFREQQSPRGHRDYSANRERRLESSKFVSPAVAPASFLDRLHFGSETPVPRDQRSGFLAKESANRPAPSVYPKNTEPSDKRQAAPDRVAPVLSRHEETTLRFPSPGSNRFSVEDSSNAGRAPANSHPFPSPKSTGAITHAPTLARPAARDGGQASYTESQTHHSSQLEKSRATEVAREVHVRSNRERASFKRNEDRSSFERVGSSFERVDSPTPTISRSQYPASADANDRKTLSFPAASPPPAAQRGSSFYQSAATHDESAARFSEDTRRPQTVVQMKPSFPASKEKFGSHKDPKVSDLNKNCWPTLPAASEFDLADDLCAREAEADTLRRLEQEQRGTLWSE